MKSILTVAALLAGLATPALAEEATTTTTNQPPPQTQAALAPSQDGAAPAVLPQSEAVKVVPMSVPLESNGAPPARGGGCSHSKTTVYLTN
ncbi:MAG: hypothetical protein WCJ41_04330 [Aestuariivirga sp.]|uniref:hypothetical protein n=1 Tax=Aestuariivirga sp. TaxID=2650926 RepID=UPI00301A2376